MFILGSVPCFRGRSGSPKMIDVLERPRKHATLGKQHPAHTTTLMSTPAIQTTDLTRVYKVRRKRRPIEIVPRKVASYRGNSSLPTALVE